MLVSHSQSFSFFRCLLILSVFVVCLVLVFNLTQKSARLRVNVIPENNSSADNLQKNYGEVANSGFAELFSHLSGLQNTIDSFPTWVKGKTLCPIVSPKLIGWTNISVKALRNQKHDTVQRKMAKSGVSFGGRYRTKECESRHKVAVVVPIRNRAEHLTIFLRYMHPFLQRQQLDYAIIVIEQTEGSLFNRGMLMNIGFVEAQNLDNFQCFIFHDVDLLPENDGNPYSCPEDGMPRQMSFSLDFWDNYEPSPAWHFGGVTALTTNDFRKINGFSNAYWGWGGEDSDLFRRVKFHNLTSTRTFDGYPSLVHLARYTSLSHQKAEPNPNRFRVLAESITRIQLDGLVDLSYRRLHFQLKPLYTSVLVEIQQPIYETTFNPI